jgi:2-polyprenyl-3-methyl-5-hydroxy-6-metoxy-1,4-benzoquinol methylase
MTKPREEDYTQEIRVSNIFNTNTVELIQDKNILDLGIHQGHLANFAFSFGAKSITGIEQEAVNCDLGKSLYPDINFINKDLNTENYLDLVENADVIFCLGVSYYISNVSDLVSNISSHSNIKTIIFETAFIEEDLFISGLYNLLSEETLTKIFTDNLFDVVDIKKYKLDTDFAHMSDRIVFVLNKN